MLQFVTIAPCFLPLPAIVADNRVVFIVWGFWGIGIVF